VSVEAILESVVRMRNNTGLDKILRVMKINGLAHYEVKFSNGVTTTLSQSIMEAFYKDELFRFFVEANK
jgi:hypothetical protein